MPLQIAIVGYGKMGKEIERAARAGGIGVKAIIDPAGPGAPSITPASIAGADVCVEFTTPGAAVGNIEAAAAAGVPIVVGTTGWYDRLGHVRGVIERAGTALVYAPNFSPGIAIVSAMLRKAAASLGNRPEYMVSMVETHHVKKLDRPSGTAIALAGIVDAGAGRKVPIESVRTGDIVGEHVILFDSPNDTIELKHAAKNRSGFVAGALAAAAWVIGRRGIFTMEDVV